MKTFFRNVLWVCIMVTLTSCQAAAPAEPSPDTVFNMMWIGDSFLRSGPLDMQTMLMLSNGPGGNEFLQMNRLVGADHTLASGTIPERVKQGITAAKPDLLVIQAWPPGEALDEAQFLSAAETWFSFLSTLNLPVVIFYPGRTAGQDPDQYHKAVRAVLQSAWANGSIVAPLGDAWQAVQDLRPETALYTEDQKQATASGVYLSAAVFYSVFTGRSAEEHPIKTSIGFPQPDTIITLEEDLCLDIQRMTWMVMEGYRNRAEFPVEYIINLE